MPSDDASFLEMLQLVAAETHFGPVNLAIVLPQRSARPANLARRGREPWRHAVHADAGRAVRHVNDQLAHAPVRILLDVSHGLHSNGGEGVLSNNIQIL